MFAVDAKSDAPRFITATDLDGRVTWSGVADAIAAGHRLGRAHHGDVLLDVAPKSWLTRAAHIPGLGMLAKTASVYPDNPQVGRPTIQGAAILLNDETGAVDAIIDNDALTRAKTAADSLLGSRFLARAHARRLLIVGAGVVAGDLARAYSAEFDLERIRLWNRSLGRAKALALELAGEGIEVEVVDDLSAAVPQADIVATATMSRAPLILGEWVRPGSHVDLVGAYTPQMRESDDALMSKAEVFVDSRETTVEQTGDLAGPIASGCLSQGSVRGSLYELVAGQAGRSGEDAVTVFKNGGGGHIDLMVARFLFERVCAG